MGDGKLAFLDYTYCSSYPDPLLAMLPVLLPAARLAQCYSDSYAEAHQKFRQQAGDQPQHSVYREFVYRQSGPMGEKLVTAVAWRGDASASRVLVLLSATHGVEGFAGSAIQLDSLHELSEAPLPEDVAVLYVHAVNPFGFAWLRRVNEDGIDLNRNCVDFTQALPANPGYAELAEVLLPATDQDWAVADARLRDYRESHGQTGFESAVSAGQYEFADGLFYGGQAPSQSRRYIEDILQAFDLTARRQVAVVDIHTGLGPFGYGEVICDHLPGSAGVEWAKRVYGQSVTEPALGTSSSVAKQGLLDYLWQAWLGDKVCYVTLEFGTYSVEAMFEALRHDHVLHRRTVAWHSPHVQQVKQRIRRNFYPATADWQEMILLRGRQIIRQALQGLQASM